MVKFKPKKRRWRCCRLPFYYLNNRKRPSSWLFLPPTFTCWKLSISLILLIIEFLPPLLNGVSAAALAASETKNRTTIINKYENVLLNMSKNHIVDKNHNHITDANRTFTDKKQLMFSNLSKNAIRKDGIVIDKNLFTTVNRTFTDKQQQQQQQKQQLLLLQQRSRRTFESLIGKEFEDEPLDPPEWSTLSKQARRELRRQSRRQRNKTLKNLPGGRRALVIATRDAIKPGHCRIMPMKQRVRMEGCATKVIVNSFCYGQCNSFFIPKLSKKTLKTAFESCSVCQPTQFEPLMVTLNCTGRQPPYVVQQVMTIKQCTCKSVCSITNDVNKKV